MRELQGRRAVAKAAHWAFRQTSSSLLSSFVIALGLAIDLTALFGSVVDATWSWLTPENMEASCRHMRRRKSTWP